MKLQRTSNRTKIQKLKMQNENLKINETKPLLQQTNNPILTLATFFELLFLDLDGTRHFCNRVLIKSLLQIDDWCPGALCWHQIS